MRRYLLFIFLLTGSIYGFAQVNKQDSLNTRTLFKSDYRVGVVGTHFTGLARFNEGNALYMGGGVGVVLNRKYTLGAYGMSLMNPVSVAETEVISEVPTTYYDVNFNHYGMWLAYNHKPHRLFHLNADLMFGAGKVNYSNEANPPDNYSSTGFFVVTPYVGAEVNLTSFARLGAGVGYQFTNGFAGRGPIHHESVRSTLFRVSLSLGYFGD